MRVAGSQEQTGLAPVKWIKNFPTVQDARLIPSPTTPTRKLYTMFELPFIARYASQRPVIDPVQAAYAYDAMEDNPNAEMVINSYNALQDQIAEQFRLLVNAGLEIEWIEGEPYANSADMRADVAQGKIRARVTFGTDYSDIDRNHPMARWCQFEVGEYRWVRLNDAFRVVHDVLGHYASSSGFGPDGECVAWLNHRATLTSEAHMALWCETRGQNAWTNFFDDHGTMPVKDRPFADQKSGHVPYQLY